MRKRLHKQARTNTCAVASLRTVLDVQLGIKVPEVALEAHATTVHEPITAFGTSTTQLRAMVRGVNRTHNAGRPWRFRCAVAGTLEDLARELLAGRTPMTRMWSTTASADYHMIVVLALVDDRVKVFDPSPFSSDEPHWMSAEDFCAWWSGDGETSWYAVINAD